jgi:hypothetical protein
MQLTSKVKYSCSCAHQKSIFERWNTAPGVLNLQTRRRQAASIKSGHFIPIQKIPHFQLIRKLGGAPELPWMLWKWEKCLAPGWNQIIILWSSSLQPIHSTDYAVPAHKVSKAINYYTNVTSHQSLYIIILNNLNHVLKKMKQYVYRSLFSNFWYIYNI